mmetsp:Transcript_21684/g.45826  ORF Transcript_21684/g.45826 Transcript_21684/m.45826 type:complete len:865 (+) Transcript_21684:59-2653(+)
MSSADNVNVAPTRTTDSRPNAIKQASSEHNEKITAKIMAILRSRCGIDLGMLAAKNREEQDQARTCLPAAPVTATISRIPTSLSSKKRKRNDEKLGEDKSPAAEMQDAAAATTNQKSTIEIPDDVKSLLLLQQQSDVRNPDNDDAMIEKQQQQRKIHIDLMLQAAQKARYCLVTLELPKDSVLGVKLESNILYGMPEIIEILQEYPAWKKIPMQFHQNSCILWFKCGEVTIQPRTAQECLDLVALAKKAENAEELLNLEMLLVQPHSLEFSCPLYPTLDGQLQRSAERVKDISDKKVLPSSEVNQPPPKTTQTDENDGHGVFSEPNITSERWLQEQHEWNTQYEALVKFKQQHGNCNDVSSLENEALANWIRSQRKNRKDIRMSRREKLDKIGFDWFAPPPISLESTAWKKRYDTLVAFKEKHGHCDVSQSEDKYLAHWAQVQRMENEQGTLTNYQLSKLNQIGFNWSSVHDLRISSKSNPEEACPGEVPDGVKTKAVKKAKKVRFGNCKEHMTHEEEEDCVSHQQFDDLAIHKEIHSHVNVAPSESGKLADWLKVQRDQEENGEIDKWKEKKLNEVDVDWAPPNESTDKDDFPPEPNADKRAKLSWDERCEPLARFKERCGSFPALVHLRGWLELQKVSIGSNPPEHDEKRLELGVKLTTEHVQKLREQIGGDAYGEWHAENLNESLGKMEEEKSDSESKEANQTDNFGETNHSDWWQTPEAATLFGFTFGVDDVLKGLQERVNLLRTVNKASDGWKDLVPNDGKEDMYTDHDIMFVRHKALYLMKAYLLAMTTEKMEKKTWAKCCEEAGTFFDGLGLLKEGLIEGMIQRWNIAFSTEGVFPHPNTMVEAQDQGSLSRHLQQK